LNNEVISPVKLYTFYLLLFQQEVIFCIMCTMLKHLKSLLWVQILKASRIDFGIYGLRFSLDISTRLARSIMFCIFDLQCSFITIYMIQSATGMYILTSKECARKV